MKKEDFVKNLKDKMKSSISKLELKFIKSFYQNKTTKKILKDQPVFHDFGRTYELYIAWLFHDRQSNYDKFLVKVENNNKEGKANDGVDIIYPYEKEKTIYIIQVKTNDVHRDVAKVEKRANEFLEELQNDLITTQSMANKWKISSRVIEKLEPNKNRFIQKTLWITPNGSTKENKIINYQTEHWGVFQILNIRNFENPENTKIDQNYEFEVTSAFSSEKSKAIIETENKKIISLVIPLTINQLYELVKNKITTRKESLFIGNVRYYQGNTKIIKSIKRTLESTPQDFYKFNNGITSVSQKIEQVNPGHTGTNAIFKIKGINIINGQQTTNAIIEACDHLKKEGKRIPHNAYVLFKVFAELGEDQVNQLAMATNQQKLIKASELISNWSFNRILQDELISRGIFYKPKTGNNPFTDQYKEWPKVQLVDVLKYWYIKEEGDVWVKNKVNTFIEALVSPHLFTKNINEKYSSISKKFRAMKGSEKANVFREIASIFVEIKDLKSKENDVFDVKQSLDMYSYFLLTNPKVARSQKFVDFFNRKVSQFSLNFINTNKSKNIANAFKTKKNSKELFNELKVFFENQINL